MKKIIKVFVVALAIGALAPTVTVAQMDLAEVGQSTMTFLEVGLVPAATGMGNAYTIAGSGASSVFYNPSGLSQTSGYNVFLSHTRWIADINYTAGVVARDFGNFGVVGISVLNVDYGTIQRTVLIGQADAKGFRDDGTINIGAHAVGLTYARQISTRFSMGGQVQVVGQTLGETEFDTGRASNRVVKPTLNFGVKYDTGYKGFMFGMSMRNFSTSVTHEKVSAQLPLVFTAGVAIDMLDVLNPTHNEGSSFVVTSEFLHPNNHSEQANVGGEYKLMNGLFALRGGYQFNRDAAGVTGGFGIAPQVGESVIGIDYSYSEMATFSGVHRFSLDLSF